MGVIKSKIIANSFINFLNIRGGEVNQLGFNREINTKHRLELFLSIRGIVFIDDTKAQSVNALWYSLENVITPVVLIIKEIKNIGEFLALQSLLKIKVKSIILLTGNALIVRYLSSSVERVILCDNLDSAVKIAYYEAESGEGVLYSPVVEVETEIDSWNFREAVRAL